MKLRNKKKNYNKYIKGQLEVLKPDKDSIVIFKYEPNKYTCSQVYTTFKMIKRIFDEHKNGELIAIPKELSLEIFTKEQLGEVKNYIDKVLEVETEEA